jgi:endonuclease G
VFPRVENTSYDNWFICKNPAYTSCIDTKAQLPVWVSHAITNELIEYGDTIKRKRPSSPKYIQDDRYKILKNNAYNGSGYDHGHMAPAADFKWDASAYKTSFLMTNMAPQHACLNEKGWCHIEAHCRKWAIENPGKIVYMVTGIIPGSYIDTLCISKKLTVFVPGKFYKAILLYDSLGEDSKTIGFIVDNRDMSLTDINNCIVTVDHIEELTALDLFSFLPDDLEEEIESVTGVFEIVTTKLDCSEKECSSIYKGKRKLPEKRTKLKCH